MSQSPQQAEPKVALPVSVVNAVADYLSTKPFREVAPLIQALSQGEMVGGPASGNGVSGASSPAQGAAPAVAAAGDASGPAAA